MSSKNVSLSRILPVTARWTEERSLGGDTPDFSSVYQELTVGVNSPQSNFLSFGSGNYSGLKFIADLPAGEACDSIHIARPKLIPFFGAGDIKGVKGIKFVVRAAGRLIEQQKPTIDEDNITLNFPSVYDEISLEILGFNNFQNMQFEQLAFTQLCFNPRQNYEQKSKIDNNVKREQRRTMSRNFSITKDTARSAILNCKNLTESEYKQLEHLVNTHSQLLYQDCHADEENNTKFIVNGAGGELRRYNSEYNEKDITLTEAYPSDC